MSATPEKLTVEVVQDIQQAIHSGEFSSAEVARFVGQRLLPYIEAPEPAVEVLEATPEEWAKITEKHPEIGLYPGGSPAERAALAEVRGNYQPGGVAIATVGALQGVHVLRAHNGWYYADRYESGFVPDNDDEPVTVTSRAVVVTEADVEELTTAVYGVVRDYYSQFNNVIREWFAARLGGGQ